MAVNQNSAILNDIFMFLTDLNQIKDVVKCHLDNTLASRPDELICVFWKELKASNHHGSAT